MQTCPAASVFTPRAHPSFGRAYPFNIVGTDPALGAATTSIPTVIVPIKLTFPNSRVLDGTNQAASTENSPIFLTADYTTGGTDVGVTQYGDAIQRAEFWNLAGFSQAGYHVLLGAPTMAPTVSIVVPASGCTISPQNPAGSCGNTYNSGSIGVVNADFFDAQLNALIASYSPNVLPIFLTDNVFEGSDGTVSTCCVLGYHNSEGPPIATARTWIYAAYTRTGTFQRQCHPGRSGFEPRSRGVAERSIRRRFSGNQHHSAGQTTRSRRGLYHQL